MKLIVDAMGGDHAPREIVLGAVRGMKESDDISLIFVGDEEKIRDVLKDNDISSDGIEIVHAPTKIEMDEDPLCILKSKKDSSMAKGLLLLRDGEGDAFLSAGSTGALIVGASSRIYKLKATGIRRCAIGTVLPLIRPTLLLDSGANIEVAPNELLQFAYMGKAYMKGFFGIKKPKIGLVNNGAEETKGTALYVETHKLLKEAEDLNFVGNVEGRDIPLGAADVLVCDGFVGNVILKLSEGFGKFIGKELKGMFKSSVLGMIAALLLKKKVKKFKARLSYEKYGGAPVLGTVRPVIKAHGSSKASAIKSAVLQAEKCFDSEICQMIMQDLSGEKGE
ncbi:MAG: phosphate acyltransferase PlsX [Clostridia bacterium]|nr:phosphate acyltransferase PlsX [Clostridia bacterium]